MTIRTNVDPIVRYSHSNDEEQHQEMDFFLAIDAGRVFFEQQTIIEISDAIRMSMENVRSVLDDADRDDDSTLRSTCSLGLLDNMIVLASLHHEAQEQEEDEDGEGTTTNHHHYPRRHYDDDEDSLKLVEGRVRRLRERRQTKSGSSQQQFEEVSDEYDIPLSSSTSSTRPSSSWFHQHRSRGAPTAMFPNILFDMEEAEDVETIGAGFEPTEMDSLMDSLKLPRTSRLPVTRRIRRTTSQDCDERDDFIWWEADDAEFEIPLAGSE